MEFSTNLDDIASLQNYPDDDSCFVINTNTDDRIVLCASPSETKSTPTKVQQSWIKDIYFFKEHCSEDLAVLGFSNFSDNKVI